MDPLRRKSAWSTREIDYVTSDTGRVSQIKAPVCSSAFEALEKPLSLAGVRLKGKGEGIADTTDTMQRCQSAEMQQR
jgi:hypothetical protein